MGVYLFEKIMVERINDERMKGKKGRTAGGNSYCFYVVYGLIVGASVNDKGIRVRLRRIRRSSQFVSYFLSVSLSFSFSFSFNLILSSLL